MKQPVVCPKGTVVYRKSAGIYVYITVNKEYKKDKKYNVNKRVSIGKLEWGCWYRDTNNISRSLPHG